VRIALERELTCRLTADQGEWLTLPKAVDETEDMLKTVNEQSNHFCWSTGRISIRDLRGSAW